MHQNFVYLFLCVIVSVAFADNPICDNTEEYQIYNTRCFSFGDEFVFVSKNWPEYDNGEEKPEEGTTCFEKFRISEDSIHKTVSFTTKHHLKNDVN